jgi:2-oxoisovalerate dehydrogenase E1 component
MGKRPVFELQFIDFIGPAWNQVVTNLLQLAPGASFRQLDLSARALRALWRLSSRRAASGTARRMKLPSPIIPGSIVVIPSNPGRRRPACSGARCIARTRPLSSSRNICFGPNTIRPTNPAVSLGKARLHQPGSDVTVIAWGNTMEKAIEALGRIGSSASVELIDLRSIAPWDKETIDESVRKTGRLVVVQEDTENCSVGQMIISSLTSEPDLWQTIIAPPTLVTKAMSMIGYKPYLRIRRVA